MDPLSALSIAASVVQFVDFGKHLLSASYELYRSPDGVTAKEVELSTISKDMAHLVARIKDNVETTASGDGHNTAADHQLLEISKECELILAEFKGALDALERPKLQIVGRGTTQKPKLKMAQGAILKALTSVWNGSEIDRKIGRLGRLKSRLITATLFCLWDDSKRREHSDLQFSQRLDDMTAMLRSLDDRDRIDLGSIPTAQNGIHSGRSVSSKPTKSVDEVMVDVLNDGSSPEGVRIHEELVEYLWNPQHSPESRHLTNRGSTDTSTRSATTQNSFCSAIIESLSFETLKGREEAISKPFERTLSWIFLPQPEELDGKQLWSSFPEWLEDSTHRPYWITGKPGSGKSTLMKFILQQPSIKSHLQKWAGDFDLLITSYYAWVAGSDLQKSCEGLMRTLLYQILRLNPSLIPEVAPRRWSLFVTLRSIVKMPPWQRWEIEESFEALLFKCGPILRLALFIDGLDEFDSPPFRVLELIHNLSARNGIKICVASRQWTEFNDAFRQNPMLRMQDLTNADMAHFVQAKLDRNRGFLDLKRVFPLEATNLIGDVVSKANGVFLWVSLVVTSLLEALTEGDGLSQLQATIKDLPSDIAQLYDAIWSRIRHRDISASAKLLVTFKAAQRPLSHLNLWLADESDETKHLDFDINSLTADGRKGVADIMHRRLDSRTRGILEISHDGTVDFLHRTARDWTFQPSVWHSICSTIPEDFDPYLLLLKAETLRTTDVQYAPGKSLGSLWHFVNKALCYASQAGDFPANVPKLVQILDMFNAQVDKIAAPYVHTTLTNHQLHMEGWHWKRQGVQVRLHWSSTRDQNYMGAEVVQVEAQKKSSSIQPNTFLGLMAQYCVLPYLQTKLSLNRNLTKPSTPQGYLPLLDCAVFGCDDIIYYSGVLSSACITSKKRIETVAFLLELVASPKQTMFDNIRLRSAREKFKHPVINSDRDSESSSYWEQVEELMNRKLATKRTLKSRLGLTKGP
ncbi:hypothetical protein V8E51_006476 [Hyaloscypha variabilis]